MNPFIFTSRKATPCSQVPIIVWRRNSFSEVLENVKTNERGFVPSKPVGYVDYKILMAILALEMTEELSKVPTTTPNHLKHDDLCRVES
jgi:hypothetical protein